MYFMFTFIRKYMTFSKFRSSQNSHSGRSGRPPTFQWSTNLNDHQIGELIDSCGWLMMAYYACPSSEKSESFFCISTSTLVIRNQIWFLDASQVTSACEYPLTSGDPFAYFAIPLLDVSFVLTLISLMCASGSSVYTSQNLLRFDSLTLSYTYAIPNKLSSFYNGKPCANHNSPNIYER